ncbi:crotonobetainyl-CoA:carnitine CoA-transferase CaiB-like acyl-CoA transferase [Amycolatopsis umgeniensis]|uniref:Crotonobetainyl-CoA:carnitine CoA-transferase CaiB-like acyl-CoA transferase n=1 Tax=Amycolatopsis umgeniensis TaxID=336628 RepID=A0A841BCA7_9PSEU|nr:crotonobetainyl-CoA:carnitine CoA-transferase CaiB-like acyl-CoA transferase [Amycolatopsis umgeniensis]
MNASVDSRVWTTLTGDTLAEDAVEVTGPESVLPGTFRVEEAATTSIAAATLAAGELLRLRGIEPGKVSVDTRHAAASFHSEQYIRVDGEPVPFSAPLSGDYRANDGWVRLHCNYPRHVAAVCWGLGVPATREAFEKVVAAKSKFEVESAVVGAGGAAAVLRSREEWLAHKQGQASSALPIAEIRTLGPSDPVRLFASDRPLGGVRILDLTHVIAGPVAGRVLAAHGATVMHIGSDRLPTVPPLAVDTGMGKLSAYVDLETEAGRSRLRKLIARADVVLQGFRPGSLVAKGFSPEALAELRPGIVVADLSAYGWEGPWARRRGFDSLVQMASGIADEGGKTAGIDGPGPLPVQALDHATGWLTAAAIMTAVRRAVTEGGSQHVRTSLAGTGEWLNSLGRKESGPAEFDGSEWLEDADSPLGLLTRVKMAGTLPGANPFWVEGTRVSGSDRAVW